MSKKSLLALSLLLHGIFWAAESVANIKMQREQIIPNPAGHTSKVSAMAFGPENTLYTASFDKTFIKWDLEGKKILKKLILSNQVDRNNNIYTMKISPSGHTLVLGGWIKEKAGKVHHLLLWDTQRDVLVRKVEAHRNVVLDMAFSPDGKYFVTSSADQTVKVWETQTWKQLSVFYNTAAINKLAISDDSALLAAGDNFGNVHLWLLGGFKHQYSRKVTNHAILFISFGEKGEALRIVDSAGNAWGLGASFSSPPKVLMETGLATFSAHAWNKSYVYMSQFSKKEGKIVHRYVELGKNRKHRRPPAVQFDNVITSFAHDPFAKRVAFGGGKNSLIKVYDLEKEDIVFQTRPFVSIPRHVAFSSDSSKIYVSYRVSATVEDPKPEHFRGFKLSFGDSDLLDVVPEKRTAKLPKLRGKIVKEGAYRVFTKTWSPNILEIHKNGEEIAKIVRSSKNGFRHNAFSLTPAKDAVVSGGDNGFLTKISIDFPQTAQKYEGHYGDILSLAISEKGEYLLTASYDGSVKLWDLSLGRKLLTLYSSEDGSWLAWTDSDRVFSSKGMEDSIGFVGFSDQVALLPIDQAKTKIPVYEDSHERMAETLRREKPMVKLLNNEKNPIQLGDSKRVCFETEIDPKGNEGALSLHFFVNKKLKQSRKEWGKSVLPGRKVRSKDCFVMGDMISVVDVFAQVGKKLSDRERRKIVSNNRNLRKPNLKFLGIGVNKTLSNEYNLEMASRNIVQMGNFFLGSGFQRYNQVSGEVLTNRETTMKNLRGKLSEFRHQVQVNDIYLLYYSGRAFVNSGNQFRFAVFDTESSNIEKTTIDLSTLDDFFKTEAFVKILIVDSAMTGNVDPRISIRDYANLDDGVLIIDHLRSADKEGTGSGKGSQSVLHDLLLDSFQVVRGDHNANGMLEVNEYAYFLIDEMKKASLGKIRRELSLTDELSSLPVIWYKN